MDAMTNTQVMTKAGGTSGQMTNTRFNSKSALGVETKKIASNSTFSQL